MDWIYQGVKYEPPKDFSTDDYYGFVYCITNRTTNRKYIGKKFFWSKKTLPPLKGYKRKRRSIIESNWRDYYGSSKEVQQLVEDKGTENYSREILHLCKSKGTMSYYEAKIQFQYDVLLSDEYYNEFIGCKIHSKHLKL